MVTNIKHQLQVLVASFIISALALVTTALAAPLLSYEELVTVSDSQIVITWLTSNETSSSGIEYGIVTTSSNYTTDEGSSRTNYHYLELNTLFPNTTYHYRIYSTNASGETTYGESKTVQTLAPPSGQYLFSFATLSDLQLAENLDDTYGSRGRPYSTSEAILQSAVNKLVALNPSFTIVKGDLVDNRSTNLSASVSRIISQLDTLKAAQPVFPFPGNHDKSNYATKDTAGTGWYVSLLEQIFDPTSFSQTGFSNFSYDTHITDEVTEDSVYNYSFDYSNYHFILLDSVRQRDGSDQCRGHVNTTWLANDLDNNSTKKTFVFMHFVITREGITIPDEVLSEVIGSDPSQPIDMTKIDLDNRPDFLALLGSHEANIAGVFMGHIHDNARYYLSGYDFPFVRTAALIQFPVGYNVYKVYSNGYIQSFYKLPYYSEISRNNVTSETYSAAYWQQLSLGSTYDRNFSITYSALDVPPTIETTAPPTGAADVSLNQPIIINFTTQMSTSDTERALNITPALTGQTHSWSNSNSTLTIDHSNLAASTTHTVTIDSSAMSSSSQTLAADFTFNFTTGTTATSSPPGATINPITNNITTDPTPTFTGIATDEVSTIATVEYCSASASWSDWKPCTPLDGSFNENQEEFIFTITPEVTRGQHQIQIRCTNAAGITTTSNFASYAFYYVGNQPEITITANSNAIIHGDPIKSNPSFEVTVVSNNGLTLSNLIFYLNSSTITAAFASQAQNNTLTSTFYNPTLSDGTYNIKVQATDDIGNITTKEVTSLIVTSSPDVQLLGRPLNCPNPFDPGSQATTIGYTLTKANNITLRIFDLAGNVVATNNYSSSQSGGQAGYNGVTWDGKTSSGSYVGNGIYVYLIIADGKVVPNGRGKLTVFKR
ncbi:hypothetical protein COT42_02745 [Candidatus Saganbacteria bacterium CG08_land_8_20_14_0_20_45_16]|uniref:Fibronectin type-III domain-containing protein n=1 Tax=Candidatus Saganbacteria bacterium CG08_land_8_20_14_0_20_45_16 TaxID=2014293 RepID=A0A2H0XZM0_UNCSA|nr:MAG: hypothetical protein COT42_02745 [Candidatus Saganbacteria bacterium CG08_land_8_20_14_0_20_45_16]